jgi:hypothetical protein
MNIHKWIFLPAAIVCGIGFAFIFSMYFSTSNALAVNLTRYVALSGSDAANDCLVMGSPCQTIQHAIDSATAGEEIHIAGGLFTKNGIVASIDKELTLRGGYAEDFSGHDPDFYHTTLDAQWGGSVISATSAGEVHLEFLTIQHGNGSFNNGYGGGVYAADSNLRIFASLVTNNIANLQGHGRGGGVYVSNGEAEIRASQLFSNTANADPSDTTIGYGGGVMVDYGSALIAENQIINNRANSWYAGYGAGIYLTWMSHAEVMTNTIAENYTNDLNSSWSGFGGGIYLSSCDDGLVSGNVFVQNEASKGAGTYMNGCYASVNRNRFIQNQGSSGAGVAIDYNFPVTLTNNLFADNCTEDYCNAVFVSAPFSPGPVIKMVNNTLVNNMDSGVEISEFGILTATNNIFRSHQAGIYAYNPLSATVQLDTNLFWDTTDPITGSNAILADPQLAPNYHPRPGSPAIDAGLEIPWLSVDLDGNPRPQDSGFDLGALEGAQPWEIYLPIIQKGS